MSSTPPSHGGQPAFRRAAQGYHPGEVDNYIRELWNRVRGAEQELAHQIAALAGRAEQAAKSPQAQQLVTELMRLGLDEITQQKAAADAEAAQLLATARSDAAQLLAEARKEADGLVAGAREQADSLLSDARTTAKQTESRAAATAAAVSEGAQRRLEALTATHEETLQRLGEISDVTTRLVAAEKERGPLPGEVDRAMAGADPGQSPAGQ